MGEFHSQLVSKARDLFPSLTEEDLEPYLLRSRATSAYDAVTLLARSVGVTFDQHQDEGNCPSVEQVQTALERNMVGWIPHNNYYTCSACKEAQTSTVKFNLLV